ncbi:MULTISPECIES: hypothetical protein [unclassified Streptomyces]|uniref:hypothetical protein n=1 Tax=unclassified Streptomyces TaxID=2593676 RepID=UPI00159EFF6C|nr:MULTISPECIES: hypothetical protein [unclassified Streptomyces]
MTGLALGFAGYFGGFGAFIVVAVLGLAGLITGYLARGDVHVADYVPTRSGDGRRETGGDGRQEADRHRTGYGTAPRAEYRTRVR